MINKIFIIQEVNYDPYLPLFVITRFILRFTVKELTIDRKIEARNPIPLIWRIKSW